MGYMKKYNKKKTINRKFRKNVTKTKYKGGGDNSNRICVEIEDYPCIERLINAAKKCEKLKSNTTNDTKPPKLTKITYHGDSNTTKDDVNTKNLIDNERQRILSIYKNHNYRGVQQYLIDKGISEDIVNNTTGKYDLYKLGKDKNIDIPEDSTLFEPVKMSMTEKKEKNITKPLYNFQLSDTVHRRSRRPTPQRFDHDSVTPDELRKKAALTEEEDKEPTLWRRKIIRDTDDDSKPRRSRHYVKPLTDTPEDVRRNVSETQKQFKEEEDTYVQRVVVSDKDSDESDGKGETNQNKSWFKGQKSLKGGNINHLMKVNKKT